MREDEEKRVGEDGFEREERMIDEGVDMMVVEKENGN